jgi:hypothetical protein
MKIWRKTQYWLSSVLAMMISVASQRADYPAIVPDQRGDNLSDKPKGIKAYRVVILMKFPGGVVFPVTELERTLIDITVRPVYAGGGEYIIRRKYHAWMNK